MNGEVLLFASRCARNISGRVLEVGSVDVNGTVRDHLPIAIGVDMRPGKGVDMVVDVVNLLDTFGAESFDCVVSCDALEHMQDWDAALDNMWGVLKPDGVMLLTMAALTKGYHGYPHDYWRLAFGDFLKLFGDNQGINSFGGKTSIGALVRKSGPLNMSIRPLPVHNPHKRP